MTTAGAAAAAAGAPLSGRTTRTAFALLALFAVLQTSALVAFAPSLLAWEPGHGHVYADGFPRAHTHPWDRVPQLPRTAVAARPASSQPSGQPNDVVFTPAAGGAGDVGSVTVPTLPAQAPGALLPRAVERALPYAATFAPRGYAPSVPTPPPRG